MSFIASALGAIGGFMGAAAGGLAAAGTVGALGTAYTGAAIGMGAMTVATVGAGAMSAYGSYQQGQAQKNMMNYQAQAAAVQAESVKRTTAANINSMENQAAFQSGQLSRQQAAVKGAQAAAMGGQGVGSSVTAGNISQDTFNKQQLDQMTLQYNANSKAWAMTNDMNNKLWGLGAQADQYSMGASNAETAGNIGAGTSLLSTASQVNNIGLKFGGGTSPTPQYDMFGAMA